MKNSFIKGIRTLCTFILIVVLTDIGISQDILYDWSHGIGNKFKESGQGCAVDWKGDLVITGYFRSDSLDLDPSANSAYILRSANQEVFVAKYDKDGKYLWAFPLSGSVGSFNIGNDVAIDGSGNIYIIGSYQGTIDFDPSSNTSSFTNIGSGDAFVAKYKPNGDFIWAFTITGGGTNALSIDIGFRSIYITGLLIGASDFDPSMDTANLQDQGGGDCFIAKYSLDGKYRWANVIGGKFADQPNSIVVGSYDENIYLTGSFSGIADFDPSNNLKHDTSNGGQDIFLASYDSNGVFKWEHGFGSSAHDLGWVAALDIGDDVYIGGQFEGTVDFNPGTNVNKLTSDGVYNAFIGKYDRQGNFIHALSINGGGSSQVKNILIRTNRTIVVSGNFSGSQDFDPSDTATAILNGLGSSQTPFFCIYDKFGYYSSASAIFGNRHDWVYSGSVVLFQDNIQGVGSTSSSPIDLDPTAGIANYSVQGEEDIFIFKYPIEFLLGLNKDHQQDFEFTVGPNPTSDFLSIDFTLAIQSELKLELMDITGKEVFHTNLVLDSGNNRYRIATSHLPNGLYLVRVISKNGMLAKKIVIQH
jgi:Secretion system C-terminal sorting domain